MLNFQAKAKKHTDSDRILIGYITSVNHNDKFPSKNLSYHNHEHIYLYVTPVSSVLVT